MTFAAKEGTFFWSNGYAWGSCSLKSAARGMTVELSVLHGNLSLTKFILRRIGYRDFEKTLQIKAGQKVKFHVARKS